MILIFLLNGVFALFKIQGSFMFCCDEKNILNSIFLNIVETKKKARQYFNNHKESSSISMYKYVVYISINNVF